MTSSSYVKSTTLRRTTNIVFHHNKQIAPLSTGVRHTPPNLLSILNLKQPSIFLSVHDGKTSKKLPFKKKCNKTNDDGCILSTVTSLVSLSPQNTISSRNDFITQRNSFGGGKQHTQQKQHNSTQLPPDILCSNSIEDQKAFSTDLKIALVRHFSVRNLSADLYSALPSSSSSNTLSNLVSFSATTMKVSYPVRKGEGGESSWGAVSSSFKQGNPSGSSDLNGNQTESLLTDDNLTRRIFHAVQNYQWYRDLIKKNWFGKRTMSLSLLLDPIIGSPPSALNSPLVEARDDISALSEGFTRKVKLHRRRLSTSFDEPDSCANVRIVHSAASVGNISIEHEGPFVFPQSSGDGGGETKKEDIYSTQNVFECEDKKAKLNAWFDQLHQEAIVKAEEGGAGRFFGGDNSSNGSNHGSSRSGDNNDSSKPTSPAYRVSEDLFKLLEKVIGCKGRNISHITVEQSVKHLCTVYMDASDDEKLKFFTILAEKYGVDHDYVTATASSLASCKEYDVTLTLEEKLRGALVPKSQWLFTQIGRLENGVKFLVDMRVDLLDAIEVSKGKSSLKALNNSLRDLIGMWFNVGFLNLERVTWQSSCDMLQKISEYEAVHPMRNWTDLKKRVGPNRRCFVFTHNSMPGEPVVILHIFLTDHIASSVQKIVSNHRMRMMSLDSDELPLSSTTEDPDSINTAIFYSITSTQRGLTGIELGNYLIKRVVRELQSEFPKMTQYSTLSPIPGFKNWLVSSIKSAMKDPTTIGKHFLTEAEISALKPIFETYDKDKNFYEVFLDVLKLNSWFSDERLVKELESPLLRLCAQYLYLVKRRAYALDPVANFHLKNGAVIWRINWLGDDSPRGLGQSCGMMVNYRYFLETCESNSQNYMENQTIPISEQVEHYIKLTNSKL